MVIFIYMTIEKLVRNYFKKTEEERLKIQSRVLTDIIDIMEGEHISFDTVDRHLGILVERAVLKEDYELAEVFTKMKEQLKIFITE